MPGKMQAYRQPMVTATGILLGFLLNVASSWVTRSFSVYRFREVVIAIGLCSGIFLLLVVLYRVLSMDYAEKEEELFYRKTFGYFMGGLAVVFLSVFIAMLQSYITHT